MLYFRPARNGSTKTLNVLPDFFRPQDLKIESVKVNGVTKPVKHPKFFQIDIEDYPKNSVIMVEYRPAALAGKTCGGSRLDVPVEPT